MKIWVWLILLLCQVCTSDGSPWRAREMVLLEPLAGYYNDTIVIGAPISFDAQDKHFTNGNAMRRAWHIFMDWVNYEKGGVFLNGKNTSVTLQYIEDYSLQRDVRTIADILIYNQSVQFMFGPYSTPLTESAWQVTNAEEVMMMSGGCSDLNEFENNSLTYGTLPSASLYDQAAFRSLANFGASSVAIISDNDLPSYCNNNSAYLWGSFFGLEIFQYYEVNPSSSTYEEEIRSILLSLKENDIDSVFGCSYLDLCIQVPSIAKDIDYNPMGMIFELCHSNPEVIETLGEDAEYILGVTPWTHSVDSVDAYSGWTSELFNRKYEDKYHTSAPYIAASAFASAEILIQAIEHTQSIDNEILADALSNMHFETFYANVTFNEFNQAIFDVLVVQFRIDNTSVILDLDSTIVVDPPEKKTHEVVFPAPTWKWRACTQETNYCSGHGACTDHGNCTCDPHYYTDQVACDTFCDGEVTSNTICRKNKLYYIGGLIDSTSSIWEERESMMNAAVDFINDKVDGWFDGDFPQVSLELRVEYSDCSSDIAREKASLLNEWSLNSTGRTLDALIGASCSGASEGASRFGNTITLPQISYSSTSTTLSNKEEYTYFARSCYSDSAQGWLLAEMLPQLGLAPFVTVVSLDSTYASSLSSAFINRFEAISSTHRVLTYFTYSLGKDGNPNSASYEEIVDAIAASGSPVVLLVLSSSEVDNIMREANGHSTVGGDSIVWVGVDLWIKRDLKMGKNGMIGLSPYTPNGTMTQKFIEHWEALDPVKFIDSDGDRSSLAPYSLQIVDSVIAISQAFQLTINEETDLEGDILKRHVYTVLTSDVLFDGVSGTVEFNAEGDRPHPIYSVVQYNNLHEDSVGNWLSIGYLTDSKDNSDLDYSKILWPDNSSGVATSYNGQYTPYCPAGQEPIEVSTDPVVYECHYCRVGYFNDGVNTEPCSSCPEGADCDDIGIVIPCILKDYWRKEPPEGELGDFDTYDVYVCDVLNSCLGGCVLNDTCGAGREQLSPTCGVCLEDYYLSFDGKCKQCIDSEHRSASYVFSMVFVAFLLLFGCQILYFYLMRQAFLHRKARKEARRRSLSGLSPAEMKMLSLGHSVEVEMSLQTDEVGDEVVNPLRQNLSEDSIKEDVSQPRSTAIKKIQQRLSQILADEEKMLAYKWSFRNALMTFKIVLSFIQVMTQSFFVFRLNWPETITSFKDFFESLNPFHANVALYSCSTIAEQLPSYYFAVTTALVIPLAFSFLLFSACKSVFIYHIFEINGFRTDKLREVANAHLSAWRTLSKAAMRLLLWFCLFCYPSISSKILSLFNCRDFGEAGVYIREDNSISCESVTYQVYLPFAIMGTALYVLGIPFLFVYAVKKRHEDFWKTPSDFLHFNYTENYKYHEGYDLLRKLTLISLVQFVAEPNSSSQALFLLGIDLTALMVLVYARPYIKQSDVFLSIFLVSIECLAFLFALLSISGISEEENYDESALFNVLIGLIIFALCIVVPLSLLLKFDKFKAKASQLESAVISKASPMISLVANQESSKTE